MPEDIFTLVGMLCTVAVVLVLAYFCTRYLAGRNVGARIRPPRAGGGHMRILDRMMLGRDLQLMVVQVGSRCFLLGVSSEKIVQVAELTAEDAAPWLQAQDAENGAQGAPPRFRDAFLDALKKKKE